MSQIKQSKSYFSLLLIPSHKTLYLHGKLFTMKIVSTNQTQSQPKLRATPSYPRITLNMDYGISLLYNVLVVFPIFFYFEGGGGVILKE